MVGHTVWCWQPGRRAAGLGLGQPQGQGQGQPQGEWGRLAPRGRTQMYPSPPSPLPMPSRPPPDPPHPHPHPLQDLYDTIARGEYPEWKLCIQTMRPEVRVGGVVCEGGVWPDVRGSGLCAAAPAPCVAPLCPAARGRINPSSGERLAPPCFLVL